MRIRYPVYVDHFIKLKPSRLLGKDNQPTCNNVMRTGAKRYHGNNEDYNKYTGYHVKIFFAFFSSSHIKPFVDF